MDDFAALGMTRFWPVIASEARQSRP